MNLHPIDIAIFLGFIIVMPGMIAFNLFSNEMRAEADKTNARVLACFAEVKSDPDRQTILFEGDEPWKQANAALAREIAAFNERVRAHAARSGEKVSEAQLIGYRYDTALGFLLSRVLPEDTGWQGFVLAPQSCC